MDGCSQTFDVVSRPLAPRKRQRRGDARVWTAVELFQRAPGDGAYPEGYRAAAMIREEGRVAWRKNREARRPRLLRASKRIRFSSSSVWPALTSASTASGRRNSIPISAPPRMIPRKKAMGMILTGRRVGAREGFELGFVTEVVPQGQVLEAAKRWAAQILECSPMAVRASKQATYRGLDEPSLERAMRTVYPAQQENLESQDYIEGPKAFAEKRRPNWQNK